MIYLYINNITNTCTKIVYFVKWQTFSPMVVKVLVMLFIYKYITLCYIATWRLNQILSNDTSHALLSAKFRSGGCFEKNISLWPPMSQIYGTLKTWGLPLLHLNIFCVKLPFSIGDTPRLHTYTIYIIILYSQLKENILSTIRRKCCYFTKETVFSKDVSDVNYI